MITDTGFLGDDRPKTRAAVELAIRYHGEQRRKWTNELYVNHPIEVTELLLKEDWVDDEVSAAAILHDTLEDTDICGGLIQARCGYNTIRLVRQLTNTERFPNDKERQLEINLKRLSLASKQAKMIKAADILHNSIDIIKSNPGYAPKYILKKVRTLKAVETDTNIWKRAEREMGMMVQQIQRNFEEEERKDRAKFEAAMTAADAQAYLDHTIELQDKALF